MSDDKYCAEFSGPGPVVFPIPTDVYRAASSPVRAGMGESERCAAAAYAIYAGGADIGRQWADLSQADKYLWGKVVLTIQLIALMHEGEVRVIGMDGAGEA